MPQASFPSDRPIVLVGLMGAGKSSVGRLLAARLGLPFADADQEIERATGLDVATIFERFGESRFRQEERRMLARLAAGPPRVIAAGGGAFVDGATRALILDRCRAVWLDADIATLAERVAPSRNRPLLRDGDPRRTLARLAQARAPCYAEAHIRVDGTGRTPEEVAEAVAAALAERAE